MDTGKYIERLRSLSRRQLAAGAGALGSLLLVGVILLVSDDAGLDLPPESPAPLVSTTLPDFASLTNVKEKKRRFFSFLLPFVEARNTWILEQRDFLQRARAALQDDDELDARALERINTLALRYRFKPGAEPADQIDALLDRVDIIPPSLVLAQAASESAWGTSRFARLGNNLFGQWCFNVGCGMVPRSRSSGATHEVQVFDTPAEAIASYFRNINSHPAYREMRELRRQARAGEVPLTGEVLAQGLQRYSERGEEYIRDIQAIIRVNDLDELDQAALNLVTSR